MGGMYNFYSIRISAIAVSAIANVCTLLHCLRARKTGVGIVRAEEGEKWEGQLDKESMTWRDGVPPDFSLPRGPGGAIFLGLAGEVQRSSPTGGDEILVSNAISS